MNLLRLVRNELCHSFLNPQKSKRNQDENSALFNAIAASVIGALMVIPMRADATIHEIVAAFCSGGGKGVISEDGHLEAPGVSDINKKNFARPVIASQSTVTLSESPLQIVISDGNAVKYPEGTIVIDLFAFQFLLVSESNHPAIHCRNFSSLP